MPSYSKPLYYLFRRNKYFFIGCFLGIMLSSFFMPMLEDCENPSLLSSNSPWIDPEMITVLELNRKDYDLFVRLEKWYREMASPDYNPVFRNKSIVENNNKINNKLQPETVNNQPANSMIHDKKLKFYRPRFHSIELNVKMKLLICILIRQQFLIDSLDGRTAGQSKSEFYSHLIGQYMNMTSEIVLNDFKDNLLYFYPDISTGNVEKNSNLVIAFNEGRNLEIWSNDGSQQPYHVKMFDYLIKKKRINEYALVLMMTEQTLTHSFNLQQYLQQMTVSDLVLSTSDGSKNLSDSKLKYFSKNLGHNDLILNHGLLISTTLISMCQSNWSCYTNKTIAHKSIADSPDGNIHYWHRSFKITQPISITNHSILNQTISFIRNHEDQILNSIFIYPIHYGSNSFNLIQTLIALDSIKKLESEIQYIRSTIKMVNNESKNSLFEGAFGYQKARNRYEVTRWTYSNESHILMPNEVQVIRPLNRDELREIDLIKNQCLVWIQSNKHESKKVTVDYLKIENLYRKFDAVRGLEYIVDLSEKPSATYRFHILKPLNPVELLTDIPQVTENLRLTMILPVRGYQEVPLAINFLNHYVNICLKSPNHQTTLIIVLIHTRYLTLNDFIKSSLELETKEFERLKKISLYLKSEFDSNSVKIVFMNINPPNITYLADSSNNQPPRSKYPSELVYLDLISRSLASSFDEPLLLLHCRSNMLFSIDFLNRVRVNTIPNNQVFIPIPFVQYRLRTSMPNNDFKQMLKQLRSITNNELLFSISQLTANEKPKTSTFFDVRKDNGYFDELNNEFISFYLHDYIRVRKKTEQLMPIVRNNQSIVKYQNLYFDAKFDLFRIFEKYNEQQTNHDNRITLMKAIEPELKLFYTPILDDCDYFESNQYGYDLCQHRMVYGMGSKQKLAAIVYEYIERKQLESTKRNIG